MYDIIILHKVGEKMKKFILLFTLVFLTTGCTYQNLNDMPIDDCAEYVIENNTNIYNVSKIGYRYYLPRGFTTIDDVEYNEVLFSEGYKYYMYIDIVSYYNKIDSTYTYNGDAYLSQYLNYANNEGYLEVTKRDNNMFFVEMMYNYAKIEVLVREKDLKSSIINISYILSSIRYNNSVIESKLKSTTVNYKEKVFKVEKPKGEETKNILDYAEEYDNYNDINNELPDSDLVGN